MKPENDRPEDSPADDWWVPYGVFVLVFWPVSVILATAHVLFFRGLDFRPVNLALATAAGLGGVWVYRRLGHEEAVERG